MSFGRRRKHPARLHLQASATPCPAYQIGAELWKRCQRPARQRIAAPATSGDEWAFHVGDAHVALLEEERIDHVAELVVVHVAERQEQSIRWRWTFVAPWTEADIVLKDKQRINHVRQAITVDVARLPAEQGAVLVVDGDRCTAGVNENVDLDIQRDDLAERAAGVV